MTYRLIDHKTGETAEIEAANIEEAWEKATTWMCLHVSIDATIRCLGPYPTAVSKPAPFEVHMIDLF